jgi:hypothetical protein
MLIHSLPPAAGLHWIRAGWRLVRRQPLGLSSMVVVYVTMLLLPLLLPAIGIIASGVLAPFATLGLMNVCQAVHQGRPPLISSFAAPFKPSPARIQLFRLGLLNAALLSVIATVVMLAGGERVQQASDELPWDLILLQLLLYAPVLAMMWFAPPLAGWSGLTAGKAVFGSVVGCMRNLSPLLVYGLAVAALTFGSASLVGGALTMLGLSRQGLIVLLTPLVLLLMTVVQATFYPMYRAIYTQPDDERAAERAA